jgi:uncharacterized membrane-anchored protein YhcB (DUF1043 family)
MKTGAVIVLTILLVGVIVAAGAGGVYFYNTNKTLTNELSAVKTERDDLSNQLTSAKAAVAELSGKLDEAYVQVEDLTSQAEILGDQYAESTQRLGAFEAIQCNYSWADFENYWGFFPLADANFFSEFPDWNNYVFFTQWTTVAWDDSLNSTTILWDVDGKQSFLIDTERDCIVINPSVFPEVGQ